MKKESKQISPSSNFTAHPSNEEAKFKIRLIYGVAKTGLLILLQAAFCWIFLSHIKSPYSVEAKAVLFITSLATVSEVLLEFYYRLPTLNKSVR